MKTLLTIISAGLLIGTLGACKEKKVVDHNIILPKVPHEEVDTTIGRMDDTENTTDVKWGGDYKVYVHRYADDSLALVNVTSKKQYYDNKIKIRITRADGSVFFDRVFTKKAFAEYLDEAYMAKSTLLGLVYYKVDGNYLYFAGSVGSPDMMSDDFVPFNMKITRHGEIAITKEEDITKIIADGENALRLKVIKVDSETNKPIKLSGFKSPPDNGRG